MLVLAMEFSKGELSRRRQRTPPAEWPTGSCACDSWRGSSLPQNGTEEVRPPPLEAWRTSPTTGNDLRKPSSACIDWESAGTNVRQRLLRKEVIQPHLPVRLPCYDFTPIADPTFGSSLLAVGPLTSGVTNFRGVTGGVYKARERIHPGSADPGLLATPTSRSRVADSDPN